MQADAAASGKSNFKFLYPLEGTSLKEKIETIVREIYGGDGAVHCVERRAAVRTANAKLAVAVLACWSKLAVAVLVCWFLLTCGWAGRLHLHGGGRAQAGYLLQAR